jgi:hypothetical protein
MLYVIPDTLLKVVKHQKNWATCSTLWLTLLKVALSTINQIIKSNRIKRNNIRKHIWAKRWSGYKCTLCNLQSQARTHTVLVIGLHELLGNPTTRALLFIHLVKSYNRKINNTYLVILFSFCCPRSRSIVKFKLPRLSWVKTLGQQYPQVIMFTSCLPMVGGSLRVLRLLPPLKLAPWYSWNIAESGVKHNKSNYSIVNCCFLRTLWRMLYNGQTMLTLLKIWFHGQFLWDLASSMILFLLLCFTHVMKFNINFQTVSKKDRNLLKEKVNMKI